MSLLKNDLTLEEYLMQIAPVVDAIVERTKKEVPATSKELEELFHAYIYDSSLMADILNQMRHYQSRVDNYVTLLETTSKTVNDKRVDYKKILFGRNEFNG